MAELNQRLTLQFTKNKSFYKILTCFLNFCSLFISKSTGNKFLVYDFRFLSYLHNFIHFYNKKDITQNHFLNNVIYFNCFVEQFLKCSKHLLTLEYKIIILLFIYSLHINIKAMHIELLHEIVTEQNSEN